MIPKGFHVLTLTAFVIGLDWDPATVEMRLHPKFKGIGKTSLGAADAAKGRHSHNKGVSLVPWTTARGRFKGPRWEKNDAQAFGEGKPREVGAQEQLTEHGLGMFYSIKMRRKVSERSNLATFLFLVSLNQSGLAPWPCSSLEGKW